jgi:hypothetical protein
MVASIQIISNSSSISLVFDAVPTRYCEHREINCKRNNFERTGSKSLPLVAQDDKLNVSYSPIPSHSIFT